MAEQMVVNWVDLMGYWWAVLKVVQLAAKLVDVKAGQLVVWWAVKLVVNLAALRVVQWVEWLAV